jgi:hypothetical protein
MPAETRNKRENEREREREKENINKSNKRNRLCTIRPVTISEVKKTDASVNIIRL